MSKLWPTSGRACFGLAIVSAPAAAVAQAPAPGTNRVWLCAEVCAPTDSTRAIAVPTVVIVTDRAAAEDSVRSALAGLRAMRRTEHPSEPYFTAQRTGEPDIMQCV